MIYNEYIQNKEHIHMNATRVSFIDCSSITISYALLIISGWAWLGLWSSLVVQVRFIASLLASTINLITKFW